MVCEEGEDAAEGEVVERGIGVAMAIFANCISVAGMASQRDHLLLCPNGTAISHQHF